MISREQLNQIAQRTGLSLYQQEKDYLLKLFLYFYYQRYQDAIFKGGTCLKYLLGLDRFSEDLDFNLRKGKPFKEQVRKTLEEIKKTGVNYYFLKEEEFINSYACEIGFEGPLFTGSRQTQNRFRIDAGYRTGTFRKPEWKVIKSEYPEIPDNFLVLTMNLQEILTEKIVALFNRSKGRDFYDLWFMIGVGVPLDRDLLKKKVAKEKVKLDWAKICTKQDYERDLTKLTDKVPSYELVKKGVMESLQTSRKK